MRKILVICLAVMFLVVCGMPAMASPQAPDVSVEHQSEIPPWLAETGAVPMTDSEMAEVQGEGLPTWLVSWIVAKAAKAFGKNISLRLDQILSTQAFGASSSELNQLGLLGWVVDKLPLLLRPSIAQSP